MGSLRLQIVNSEEVFLFSKKKLSAIIYISMSGKSWLKNLSMKMNRPTDIRHLQRCSAFTCCSLRLIAHYEAYMRHVAPPITYMS